MRCHSEIDSMIGGSPGSSSIYGHPEDVLSDPRLSVGEKRALLAFLISDERAVENAPELRSWPSGSFVQAEDILRALKALDELEGGPKREGPATTGRCYDRRRDLLLRGRRSQPLRVSKENEDPPPASPAIALPIPEALNRGAPAPN